jgi:hypothetical protein
MVKAGADVDKRAEESGWTPLMCLRLTPKHEKCSRQADGFAVIPSAADEAKAQGGNIDNSLVTAEK